MRVAMRMLCLMTVCLAFPAGAQDLASLQHGVRIRVQPTVGDSRTGTYIGVSRDSLHYMNESSKSVSAVIPMDQVKSVQVSAGRGRGRGLLRGALIGSAIGLVGGAILGAATYSDSGDGWCIIACSRGETALFFGALLGTGGAIAGSIYGGIQGLETWRPVPLGRE
ncbi:MAG TPA: hypothetical protein VES88_17965 [Gemmatimonadaceae bacterium]|nr:hypothetical protein [Gemmatimonadaceae bacterium]